MKWNCMNNTKKELEKFFFLFNCMLKTMVNTNKRLLRCYSIDISARNSLEQQQFFLCKGVFNGPSKLISTLTHQLAVKRYVPLSQFDAFKAFIIFSLCIATWSVVVVVFFRTPLKGFFSFESQSDKGRSNITTTTAFGFRLILI